MREEIILSTTVETFRAEIDGKARQIKTDGYAMSIGEVIALYQSGDIDVHPEFQRIFRWDESQKSRLIESVLLGIPVPTVFVAQRGDGIWDVIDGVQRLSTILQFVGAYKDENNNLLDSFSLSETEYLPSATGFHWDPLIADDPLAFDDVVKRDFRRAKLDFRIVKKESDEDAKYDLFQRLNSGTHLSAQEARNCILVMLSTEYYREIVELGKSPDFSNAVQISEQKESEGFRQELVIRGLMLAQEPDRETELPQDLGDYITKWSRAKAEADGCVESESKANFLRVFAVIALALEDDAFRRYDVAKGRFLGPFLISSFEAVTAGVAHHIQFWSEAPPAQLKGRVQEMWNAEDFREDSSGSPRRRMPRMVKFGRRFFAPE